MKAAIYTRKSKLTEKGDSIENQLLLCEEYGRNIGVTEFIKYEDEGFSGGNTDRPKFQAMMKDAKAKKFDLLICYRLDRISRNVSDFICIIDELKKHNICFISIREQFDTTSPIGRAMMNIAAVFAQLERETIAERIKDNMLELAKTGRWLGGTPPLGYRSESTTYVDDNGKTKKMYKLSLIKEEIELVKLIYDTYLKKQNYSGTANYLCRHNYKGKNGGEFSRHTVEQIITNPVYCIGDEAILSYFEEKGAAVCKTSYGNNQGLMVYNKRYGGKYNKPIENWIISIGSHEAIISSEIWLRCAKIQEKNNNKLSSKTSTGEKFLLSGLLVCGECGSNMTSWSHFNKRTTQMDRYYRCNLKQKASNRCSSKMLNAYSAEEHIINFINELNLETVISELKSLKENVAVDDDTHRQMQNFKDEIEKNNKIIQGIIRKMAFLDDDKEILDVFKVQIKDIQSSNKSLENKIKTLSQEKELSHEVDFNISLFVESLTKFKQLSKYLTVKENRDLLLSLIDHITWNSKERQLEINWIKNCAT